MQPGQTPTCRCGYENPGNYCPNCGARQPGTKTTAERSRRPKSWKILLVSGLIGIPLSILAVITAASCMAESEEQYYYQPAEQQNQQSYYQPAGQQNQHAAPARPTSTPRPTPTPRPVTIANERISLESGEWTEYSIARYRYCDYEISADTLDIEVDGIRDRCSMPPTAPHPPEPATRRGAGRVSCLPSRPPDRTRSRTMDIHMNAGRARLDRERRLWAESRDRGTATGGRPAGPLGEAARRGQGSGGRNAGARLSTGAAGRRGAVVPGVHRVARGVRTGLHRGLSGGELGRTGVEGAEGGGAVPRRQPRPRPGRG